jgi:uncharacterized protein (DUF58 family)
MGIRRGFWGVLFFLLFAILGAIWTQIGIYYRLIYLCLFVLIVGWVWSYLSVRGFDLKRNTRVYRLQLGEILEERFDVINKFRTFRPLIEIGDHSNLPKNMGSRVLSWIEGKETRSYTTYTLLSRRGEFTLGPTALTSGDPFGIFFAAFEIPNKKTLIVVPFFVELQSFPYPPGLLPGGRAIRRRSFDITPHAAGVRDYVSGDSLNRIHWPSTARKDRLIAKEFDQDPLSDVWIILDAKKNSHYEAKIVDDSTDLDKIWLWRRKQSFELPPTTFEYSVSAAASVANYFVKQDQAVGLITAGQKTAIVPAERGSRQLDKILDLLSFITCDGDLPLQGLIQSQSAQFPRGSTVVIITASSSPTLLLAVNTLMLKSMKPVVILVEPKSFGSDYSVIEIAEELKQRNIPVVLVSRNDDLRKALERQY